MSPEVAWEPEVARWMTVRTCESSDSVLRETTFEIPNVVVGGRDSLAEDREDDDDGCTGEAKQGPSKRDDPTAASLGP